MNSRVRLAATVLLAGAVSGGCSWLTDFRQQPSVGTWQSLDQALWSDTTTPFRASPQGSVPTTGTVLAAYQVSYRPLPNVIDSMASLQNPVAPTQESVDLGWRYYQINCAVCHGEAGDGQGATQPFFLVAPSLLVPPGSDRSDGYIFGMMRNGRGLMPSMNRIPEYDRWHVINYVRGLQGRLPSNIVVQREAPGLPGVTGEALPGVTRVAPTVPVPHRPPSYVPTGGATPPSGGHE